MSFLLKDIFIQKAIKVYKKAEEHSKDWIAFLLDRYDGGSEKLPNTNPETKDQYPQVSMLTLYKNDDSFKSKVQKEFQDWKNTPKSKPSLDTKLFEKNPAMENKIQKIQNKFKEEFDRVEVSPGDIARGGFHLNQVLMGQSTKSTLDNYLDHRRDDYLVAKKFKGFLSSWQVSSSSFNSLLFCHVLGKMGVEGSFMESEQGRLDDKSDLSEEEIQDIMFVIADTIKEVYAFQQAFFRSKGLKSITLYRGVQGEADLAELDYGSDVKVKSKPLASFTSNPMVAKKFAGSKVDKPCVLEYEVPVERIFCSPLIEPDLSGDALSEEEFIVLGASVLNSVKIGVEGGSKGRPDNYEAYNFTNLKIVKSSKNKKRGRA